MKKNIVLVVFVALLASLKCRGGSYSNEIVSARIEFIGETDKAPPTIIMGLEKTGTYNSAERFYLVSNVFLNKIEKKCFKCLKKSAEGNNFLIKVTLSGRQAKNNFYLSDSYLIKGVFNCLIELAKQYEYSILAYDLERGLKKID